MVPGGGSGCCGCCVRRGAGGGCGWAAEGGNHYQEADRQQGQGGAEVEGYDAAGQFGQHGDAAEQSLYQQQRHGYGGGYPYRAVAAVGCQGYCRCRYHQRAHDYRCYEAVGVFDDGGVFGGRQEPAVAEGPVGAAQAGAGDADYAADYYQDEYADQGGRRQALQPG